jgi:two-component system nitrate/nitrite response regulator NarL
MPYKILIVDDHALVREGLGLLVSTLPGGAQVFLAGNAAEALAQAEFHTPLDAVLLDCGLPDADGGSLIQALSQRGGHAPVVVVSGMETDDSVARLLQLGAAAFVPKSKASSEVIGALMRVLGRRCESLHASVPARSEGHSSSQSSPSVSASKSLTARQLDILLMLDQGLTNRDIALQLGLSEKTVKNHITMLFNALGAGNRLQVVRKARDAGLLK